MNTRQALSILILLVAVAGAIYYAVVDREAQGTIVVLVAILYFLALPHITRSQQ